MLSSQRQALFATALIFSVLVAPVAAAAAVVDGLLRVHPDNPRYLTNDSGEPILLIGPQTWHVFQDYEDDRSSTDFDYDGWLDALEDEGFTFFRGWLWSDGYYSPLPFEQVIVQGRRVYDLSRWNERFFDRLRRRIRAAGERGLYTSVMLFQEWSVNDAGGLRRPDPWLVHPFNRSNNIQEINRRSHSGAKLAPVHSQYLRRMVDELYDLDNIIWEVGNELGGKSGPWVRQVVERLRELEDEKVATDPLNQGRRHLIWVSCIGNRAMPGPAYGADLVSPCNVERYGVGTGSSCFDVARPARPPAADGSRVVLADADHLEPLAADADWAWKSFFRGHHPLALTIPNGRKSLPWWRGRCDLDRGRQNTARLRRSLATIVRVARKADLAASVPQSTLMPDHPGTVSSFGYALFSSKDPNAAGPPDGRRFLIYQAEADNGGRPISVCGLRQGRNYRVIWRRLDNGDIFFRDRRTSVKACESFAGSQGGGILALELK